MHASFHPFIAAVLLLSAGPCDRLLPENGEGIEDGGVQCTKIACQDAFIAKIIRADNEQFIAGEYDFEVELPDRTRFEIECYLGFGEQILDCSLGDLELLGASLVDDGRSLEMMMLSAPPKMTVVVSYNRVAIGRRDFIPDYDLFMPNGPDCPPICSRAEEVMAVESW